MKNLIGITTQNLFKLKIPALGLVIASPFILEDLFLTSSEKRFRGKIDQ